MIINKPTPTLPKEPKILSKTLFTTIFSLNIGVEPCKRNGGKPIIIMAIIHKISKVELLSGFLTSRFILFFTNNSYPLSVFVYNAFYCMKTCFCH